MQNARMVHIASALVATALAVGLFTLVSRPAAAGTDLSGTWNASYSLSCAATITQSGSDLSAAVDCGKDLQVTLDGMFDSATGSFSLAGTFVAVPVTVEGAVSSDGSSLRGTWSAPPIVSEGPFSAAREGGTPSATDLTGTWDMTVENIFSGSCQAEIEQSGSALTAQLDCERGLSGAFEGTFDPDTRAISLSGPFGPFSRLDIHGTVSEDGGSITGTWFIALEPNGVRGTIVAAREGGPGPTSEGEETPAREEEEPAATPVPVTLPPTGSGGGEQGSAEAWLLGAIAGALALSAALYVAFRRVR